jgi:uncharacterized membrane protein
MQTMTQPIPPGWTYNPSAWSHRVPLLVLALVGFGIAAYLAFYQVGLFPNVWEPFFRNGSQIILHSRLARLLPIPDAALGALGYTLEVISGGIGGRERWWTIPWIVLFFGVVVGLLGLGSVLLVIAQPVLFHAWCTLCLVSAFISISMVGLAIEEVWASIQHLKRERARSSSWRRVFGGIEKNEEDKI